MLAPLFRDAPPPTRVGGRKAVPVHIVGLDVELQMDTTHSTARVDATMTYRLGPHDGHPVFDLRQSVEQCWIDGVPFDPSVLAKWDAGHPDPFSSVRVIDRCQAAGSLHRLRLRYTLGRPAADLRGAYPPMLTFGPGRRVRWSAGMADLYAGRYLEAWFPANLPFDHFPFRLQLEVTGTRAPHAFITNGHVTTLGPNKWSVQYPDWFTSMSPLMELHAADGVSGASQVVLLSDSGRPITLSVWKFADAQQDLTPVLRRIATLVNTYEGQFGPFSGDNYVCFLHSAGGGMEYAHATTTSVNALRHEVLHSWFARGVTPASQADGWWDEGFTRYIEGGAEALVPFDFDAKPALLCSRRPWQRVTPSTSYGEGSRLFGGLAALLGTDRLADAMRTLYLTHARRSVGTETLETHLLAASGQPAVVDAFHRFVYGFADPDPPPRLRVEVLGMLRSACAADASLVARIHNDERYGHCSHFAVMFVVTPKDGPSRRIAAAGFELAPGTEQIISAPWPGDLGHIDPAECTISALVHARGSLGERVQQSAGDVRLTDTRNLAVHNGSRGGTQLTVTI